MNIEKVLVLATVLVCLPEQLRAQPSVNAVSWIESKWKFDRGLQGQLIPQARNYESASLFERNRFTSDSSYYYGSNLTISVERWVRYTNTLYNWTPLYGELITSESSRRGGTTSQTVVELDPAEIGIGPLFERWPWEAGSHSFATPGGREYRESSTTIIIDNRREGRGWNVNFTLVYSGWAGPEKSTVHTVTIGPGEYTTWALSMKSTSKSVRSVVAYMRVVRMRFELIETVTGERNK